MVFAELADPCAEPTLGVGVWGPVYSRKANNPCHHRPDRKGQGDSRLRLLNVEADSFNKLLSADIAVSSSFGR
jgi:hypothetical protein